MPRINGEPDHSANPSPHSLANTEANNGSLRSAKLRAYRGTILGSIQKSYCCAHTGSDASGCDVDAARCSSS